MTNLKFWQAHLALGLLAALAGSLLAQAPPAAPAAAAGPPPGTVVEDEKGYKTLVPYIDPKLKPADAGKLKIQEGKARSFVWQVLDGKLPLNDNKTSFDYYYNKILFPNLTQTSDTAMAAMPEERQKLFRDHLERCADPTVHVYLVNMVFDQMKTIVLDNYHPAARYNAMLVISSLNDVEVSRVGADKKVPEPMIAALPFIYEQFTKADNTDAIRVAALIGLVRHLEWDNFRGDPKSPTPQINAPLRASIVKALLELAQQKDPPEGRNAAGHEWFRRRAIEGLTHAGHHRADAEIAAAMEALLKDESEPLAVRCAAASAVGKLGFQAPVKVDPSPTAKELGYLALVACHKELARVSELNKQELDRLSRLQQGSGSGGYAGGSGSGAYDGGMSGGGIMPGGIGAGIGSGAAGSADGAYGGPRPGGTVRPKGPGAAGAAGGMGGMGGVDGAYGSGGPGYGSGLPASIDPKQYRFDHIRRRIRGQIYAVEVGLVGPDGFQRYLTEQKLAEAASKPGAIASAVAPYPHPPRGVLVLAKDNKADQDYVKKVIEAVVKLARTVEETDTDLADLDKKLRKEMKALEAMTRKLAVATPVAEPSDIPDAPAAPPARGAAPAPPPPAAADTPGAAAPAAPARAAPPPAAPAPAAPAPAAPAPATPAPAAPAPAAPGGAPAAPG